MSPDTGTAGAGHDWAWPGGAKAAVSLTFDLDAEAGWLGEGEQYTRRLTTLSEGRYGVTRGLPRILALLRRYELPATFFVPGHTAMAHPGAVEQILEHGHEVAHHGFLHLRSDKSTPEQQLDEVDRGLSALASVGVDGPLGYRSSSWELTPETFDLIVDRGFRYDSSCMGDDRPYLESWGGRSLLELPVHWSLDDWPRFGWSIDGGGNVADPEEMYRSWSEELASTLQEARHTTYTMHPEVIGRPYRLLHLERLLVDVVEQTDLWVTRLDEVATHVSPQLQPPQPQTPPLPAQPQTVQLQTGGAAR